MWSNVANALSNATSTTDGSANTTAIIGQEFHTASAAKLCGELNGGGQTDWYLPAKYELNCWMQNKDAIGGFSAAAYWSSTEVDANGAWGQGFTSGSQDDTGLGWVVSG